MPLETVAMSAEHTCALLLARCDSQRGAEFIAVSDWGDVAGAFDGSAGVVAATQRCFESLTNALGRVWGRATRSVPFTEISFAPPTPTTPSPTMGDDNV